MTFLTACWLLSLALLVGIYVYAYTRKNVGNLVTSPEETPASFADFVATELTRMTGHLSHGAIRLRPYAEWAITQSRIFLGKGHNIFAEKVFGRMEIEKGKVVSFFLKRIAEHQEALRGKKREDI